MLFNSLSFIIVFPFVFLLYYLIPSRLQKLRNFFLLLTSYSIYISWKPVYVLVLLGVTLITYAGGLLFGKQQFTRQKRKYLIWIITILALFPLLVFKYYDFLNDIISTTLVRVGWNFKLPGLNWAIPIGISFFTFQAVGYMLDVYYNRIKAETNFWDYALFVSFFPSVLSGPINKASLVLPQIKNLRKYFDYEKAVSGLKMLLWGMFMKVVVADRVALYADTVLSDYTHFTGMSSFVASICYTIQIYADFAGYSLMAIGVGKVLGFELTENFRRPYFAVSVTDFWHRWHISLSTWLKDYVYIPLGGSRCSKPRNYWNIFVTFLVSGIWHGASWTFIVWGILHGLFQITEKMLGQQGCQYGWFGKIVKIVVTFMLVNFAWIFFRMPTLKDAFGVIKRIFDFSLPLTVYIHGFTATFFIGLSVAILLLKDIRDEFFPTNFKLFESRYSIIRWASYFLIIVMILLCGVFGADQFIYANF